jgi:UDP-GlcNAc:undecaprenyl-phosphate GlcNAc-1-phosphate transferase
MLFVLSFVTSLLLVILIIPHIFEYALRKQLFEASGERPKIHNGQVPHLAGIAIYIAVLAPLLLSRGLIEYRWFLLASLLVFGIGLFDDLKRVDPHSKFLFQFAAAFLVVVEGNVRIMNLQGILGHDGLDYIPSVLLSVLFVVGLVNAFNLIDGIDGLAGAVGLLICSVYSYLFFNAGAVSMARLSCSASASLVGFLFFNLFAKRKIFMGDCGSLFIGLLVAFLSIRLLAIPEAVVATSAIKLGSRIGFVVALLSIPLFDTLRVFVIRIVKKRSPFKADNNHIHHRLLSVGLSHSQATGVLVCLNLTITAFSVNQQALGDTMIIFMVLTTMIFLNCLLTILINSRKSA